MKILYMENIFIRKQFFLMFKTFEMIIIFILSKCPIMIILPTFFNIQFYDETWDKTTEDLCKAAKESWLCTLYEQP